MKSFQGWRDVQKKKKKKLRNPEIVQTCRNMLNTNSSVSSSLTFEEMRFRKYRENKGKRTTIWQKKH